MITPARLAGRVWVSEMKKAGSGTQVGTGEVCEILDLHWTVAVLRKGESSGGNGCNDQIFNREVGDPRCS